MHEGANEKEKREKYDQISFLKSSQLQSLSWAAEGKEWKGGSFRRLLQEFRQHMMEN